MSPQDRPGTKIMFEQNRAVVQTALAQIGLIRTLKFSLLKLLRKFLLPHSQFHFSQTGEDLILQHLISKYLGTGPITYADIGCNHPQRISSSYLLYLRGACGLAIDMNASYGDAFRAERPRDVFVATALSDKAEQRTSFEFSVPEVNTVDPEQARQWAKHWGATGSRVIKAETLRDVLRTHFPSRPIDVLMMDVEGHELQVLQGADLAAMPPKIVACEIHELDLERLSTNKIVGLLAVHGYKLVAYATMNGYFVHQSVAAR